MHIKYIKLQRLSLRQITYITIAVTFVLLLSFLAWRYFFFMSQGHIIAKLKKQGISVTESNSSEPLITKATDFLSKPRYIHLSTFSKPVDLELASKLPGLFSIHFISTEIRENETVAFANMFRLQNLCLETVQVPHSAWSHLAELENLKWIILNNVKLDEKDIAEISRCRKLSRLYLERCDITDSKFAKLTEIPELHTLGLPRSPLSTLEPEVLGNFTKLQKLDLEHCNNLTDESLKSLSLCPSLQILNLADCGLTDESLKALSSCSSLSTLDVSGNPITDKGLKTLSQMKNLGRIILNRTHITDLGIKVFGDDPTRGRYLEVKDTAVTQSGIRKSQNFSTLMNIKR